MSDQNLTPQTEAQVQILPTVLRSLTGAVISGGLGFAALFSDDCDRHKFCHQTHPFS